MRNVNILSWDARHTMYLCDILLQKGYFIKNQNHYFFNLLKTSAVSTTNGWLKLNFASCVIRKTRSLGALVLCSICNMVFVNYIYNVVVDTQFHKFHGRPFARVLYVFLMKDIGR